MARRKFLSIRKNKGIDTKAQPKLLRPAKAVVERIGNRAEEMGDAVRLSMPHEHIPSNAATLARLSTGDPALLDLCRQIGVKEKFHLTEDGVSISSRMQINLQKQVDTKKILHLNNRDKSEDSVYYIAHVELIALSSTDKPVAFSANAVLSLPKRNVKRGKQVLKVHFRVSSINLEGTPIASINIEAIDIDNETYPIVGFIRIK